MYRIDQIIICKKKFTHRYSGEILANIGDTFTISRIYEYDIRITISRIYEYDIRITNNIDKYHIRLYKNVLYDCFESLPEKRKRVINDLVE